MAKEDQKLIEALIVLHTSGKYGAENGFKPGYIQVAQNLLDISLPNSGLKADPHIKSRLKTWRTKFNIVHCMIFGSNTSGFGWDPGKCVLTAHLMIANGSRAIDLGDDEVASETQQTAQTILEDEDIDRFVRPSPQGVDGKSKKRKRSKSDELADMYSESCIMFNNSIIAMGNLKHDYSNIGDGGKQRLVASGVVVTSDVVVTSGGSTMPLTLWVDIVDPKLSECLVASYAFGKTSDYAFCKAKAMPLEKPNAMPSPNPEAMPSKVTAKEEDAIRKSNEKTTKKKIKEAKREAKKKQPKKDREKNVSDNKEYDDQSDDVANKEKTDEEAAKRKKELIVELKAIETILEKKAKDAVENEVDNEDEADNEEDADNNEEDADNNEEDADNNEEDDENEEDAENNEEDDDNEEDAENEENADNEEDADNNEDDDDNEEEADNEDQDDNEENAEFENVDKQNEAEDDEDVKSISNDNVIVETKKMGRKSKGKKKGKKMKKAEEETQVESEED
ncbi:hypothetical protein Tco_0570863, partial [Tanacetum coccineum]